MMGPGVIPRDVFSTAMEVARDSGLPDYVRGHIGHSVGLDHTIEEPPFLSPTSEEPMKPGNVFCVEMPYYAYGVGALQLEDMVVITDTGYEKLTSLSRELVCVG